ncbi:hypothetical protein IWQ61_008807 [Dispira simplex]|nr:hypothetical protein IWQ61_008807 [Dispira simplex]
MLGKRSSPALTSASPGSAGLPGPSTINSPVRNSITEMAVNTAITTGDCPPPLVGSTTTAVGTRLFLFAGRLTEPRVLTNDLYILDLLTLAWRKIPLKLVGNSPIQDGRTSPHTFIRPRYFHSAVVYGHKIVYFGGMGRLKVHTQDVGVLNDVLVLDTDTFEWTLPRMSSGLPPPRYAHLCTMLSGDRMLIMGGQDLGIEYLGDLHVLDLKTMGWCLSRKLDRNVGIYRSIVATDPQHDRVVIYSNHNFANVQRSLHVLTESNWRLSDRSEAMSGARLPPGLRFPTACLLGHFLIFSGTYINQQSTAFCLWALDLRNYAWMEIPCGTLFERGSWNRGVLCPELNCFYVFGHQDRAQLHDYNARQLNFHHIRTVSLEAFGIFRNVSPFYSPPFQELGLALLENPLFATVDLLSKDGLRIPANFTLLAERWKSLISQLENPRKNDENSNSPMPRNPVIRIPENHDVIHTFVRFLYTGAVDLSVPTHLLTDVLVMADRHRMSTLKDQCAFELHQRLALDTSPLIFEGATRGHHQGLRVRSLLYMFDRRDALLRKHILILQSLQEITQREILSYFPEINKHYRKRSGTNSSQASAGSYNSPNPNPYQSRRSQDSTHSNGGIPVPYTTSSSPRTPMTWGSSVGSQNSHQPNGPLSSSAGSSNSGTFSQSQGGHPSSFAGLLAPILESPTMPPGSSYWHHIPALKHSTSQILPTARKSLDHQHRLIFKSGQSSPRLETEFTMESLPSSSRAMEAAGLAGSKSPRHKNRLLKLTLGSSHNYVSGTNMSNPSPSISNHFVAYQFTNAGRTNPESANTTATTNGTTTGSRGPHKGSGATDSQPSTPLSAPSFGQSASSFASSITRPFLRVVNVGTKRSDKANGEVPSPSAPVTTFQGTHPHTPVTTPLRSSTTSVSPPLSSSPSHGLYQRPPATANPMINPNASGFPIHAQHHRYVPPPPSLHSQTKRPESPLHTSFSTPTSASSTSRPTGLEFSHPSCSPISPDSVTLPNSADTLRSKLSSSSSSSPFST